MQIVSKVIKIVLEFYMLQEILEVKLLPGQVGVHHVTGTACLFFY